jgi:phage-related tail protein
MSDEEKLDKLIGWDGSTPMWDPNDPRADIPGLIENRRPITKSIMQNIIDKITTKLPDLEKYVGKNRDEFIDDLCDFTEELRKLTIKTPVGGNSAQIRPFSARMNSILTRLQSVNESLRLSRYYNFINEDNETTSNIKQLKDLASELSKEIEGKEENEIKGLDNFKKFKGVFFKLNDNEKEKLKVKVDDEEKNLYDLLVDLLGEGGESGKTSNIEQISWNKVVQSFTKSGVSSLIPTIKSTLEDLNSNDEKKKMRSIEIINGVAKQISINITTIGKNRLSYEQLIKEDGYKTENGVINNISKSTLVFAGTIASKPTSMVPGFGAS